MKEFELKYGCNPNQKPSRIFMEDGSDLPVEILNGRPGYINFLDALNAWQLVRELKDASGLSAAASFKHVSPSGAALGLPLEEKLQKAILVDDIRNLNQSPIACAYARARGCDRMSSYGDFIALSDTCDEVCARLIRREVSDGIIAPSYSDKALEILKKKKNGGYCIIQIDAEYRCAPLERKQVFGVSFEQGHNDFKIDEDLLKEIVTENRELPESAKRDLILALITLKYTQSNSVAYAWNGQTIGVGAGQQSRIHCTRLAGSKADTWFLRQHEKVLNLPFRKDLKRADRDNVIDSYINKNEEDVTAEGIWQKYFLEQPKPLEKAEIREFLNSQNHVALASDAFFPFGDNIERAYKSGVKYVAEPGGSLRDAEVIEACNRHAMLMCFTHMRLFHH